MARICWFRTMFITLSLLIFGHQASVAVAADAVFQYAVPVATSKSMSTAFLWIPPNAKQVRGVLMGGMTLAERELAKDEEIRKACAEEQLAIVFLKTGLGSVTIPKVLEDLAAASGYRELAMAPLFFVGHSAGGPQARVAAIAHKERCFGVMQYRGGAPNGEPNGEAPVPPGVPALMMLGQFDEFGRSMMRNEAGRENWENGRDSLADFRGKDAGNLGNIVIEPGAGHFAWSDKNARYLAMYLRKAAKARIPDWPIDAKSPVSCKTIDAASGWLTDLTIKTATENKPAPVGEYKGDKARAAWHFDREMAEATIAYHQDGFSKKDQFVRWTDPHSVDSGVRNFLNEVKWVGDGQTFEVHPMYTDVYPRTPKDGKGPKWWLAGKPVENSGTPIEVRRVGGPVTPVGPNLLRMKFDALAPIMDSGRITFLAFSNGNKEFRGTEVIGMLPPKFAGLTTGKEQTITFAPIENQKPNAGPIKLEANSDSGLPVEFYIAHGPAVIENGKLIISEIPARAVFPIEVRVVAYQFGRGVEPQVKTALPVERTFRIEKP